MKIENGVAWLWHAAGNHRPGIALRCLLGTLHVGVSLFAIGVCRQLIDAATAAPWDNSRLPVLVALTIACPLAKLLLSVANSRIGNRMEIDLRNKLRHQLFGQLMESRWHGREAMHTGDAVNRLAEDVPTVTDTLCRSLPLTIVTLVQLCGALWFLGRMDELLAALHTAAADFTLTLPEGLDTRCGEQGSGLSEGQAQRIAIARGLLRPGSILLLDEPTSSLDSETERLLMERLAQRVKNKTVILITHREVLMKLCTTTLQLHKL